MLELEQAALGLGLSETVSRSVEQRTDTALL